MNNTNNILISLLQNSINTVMASLQKSSTNNTYADFKILVEHFKNNGLDMCNESPNLNLMQIYYNKIIEFDLNLVNTETSFFSDFLNNLNKSNSLLVQTITSFSDLFNGKIAIVDADCAIRFLIKKEGLANSLLNFHEAEIFDISSWLEVTGVELDKSLSHLTTLPGYPDSLELKHLELVKKLEIIKECNLSTIEEVVTTTKDTQLQLILEDMDFSTAIGTIQACSHEHMLLLLSNNFIELTQYSLLLNLNPFN